MSRILLADDSPQALRLGEQILTSNGLEVVSVTDGAIAMRRLEDVKPDLFITDVYLPTKSGFDLARYMKADPSYRDIPVIFAVAPADVFEEQDARNAGADEILRKPFEASTLLGAVQSLLAKSALAKSAKEQGGQAKPALFDRHSIRAAVTLAIETAVPAMIEELTERVVLALSNRK
ncbi:MAG TPA: response regulator [Bryobacteraceae bacterium]|nr:response regulator [Bryobacteraceae bacterium]